MTNGSGDARSSSSSVGSLGSLVVRSLSNGSLQLQQQMNQLMQSPVVVSSSSKKGSKVFVNSGSKDKDYYYNGNSNKAFVWMFKFAPRKKVGMLLLSLASFAAMLWILFIAKGILFHFKFHIN